MNQDLQDKKLGLAPQPQPLAAPSDPQPGADARDETPEEIDARLGLPPAEVELAASPQTDAGFWDVVGAAWQDETIRTDAWNATADRRHALAMEMEGQLPPEARRRIWDRYQDHGDWASLEQIVVEEAAQAAASDAGKWGQYPLSVEDFDNRILTEQKAEQAEAKAILDLPGGGFAEFLGASARAMTDQSSLVMMPFGVTGTAWKTILSEAALGAAGEAAVLPREFEMAERLSIADPDPVSRVAMGAALGGGLAAGIIGIGRGVARIRDHAAARKAGLDAARPDGLPAAEFEIGVDAAEAAMRGDRTVQESLTPPAGTLGSIVESDARVFSDVVEAGKGYTVVSGPDGKAVRREGTRAWRNNNPGNIEFGPFARSMGAIGTDGRFAVFPSYEAGRKAKATLLWASGGYRGKTISGAISRYAPSFENDTGAYTRAITKALGVSADTPMSSLTPAQREVMMDAMERVEGFRPGTEDGVQVRAPRKGISTPLPDEDAPSFAPTSRGYTGSGQVTAGDGFRIEVEYEVVDASSLLRASGDLQPRDRSRVASDAWIADTAARLDPAQLMPSPTADRGTPIVGPDNVVESGNGRFGAITRAYERHPDRGMAYRAQIEAAGFAIPEGVDRPVLIARRRTELSPEDRSRFAIEAQDSGVAVMTPTEVARASSRAMTAPVLARLDPSTPLRGEANADFVRSALQGLPRSARNAMFDAGGLLNSQGERQLREALFARAWPDPDILARYTETDAGDLKSLMEALERSAPAWAALKADIEAGLVDPTMDISGFVLDAMRLIGAARDLASRDGVPMAKAVAELLDDVDLIEGAIAPLTAALVRRFWKNGRAASADDVAGFLSRYATDARKAGAAGGMFDAPGPRDVLQAIDREGFKDLPDDLGAARGFAQPGQQVPTAAFADDGFDTGAASAEAEAADAAILADLDPARLDPPETPARSDADADAQAELDAARADLGADFDDFDIDMPDGTRTSLRELLDDLDADRAADAALDVCLLNPAASFAKGANP